MSHLLMSFWSYSSDAVDKRHSLYDFKKIVGNSVPGGGGGRGGMQFEILRH